MFKHTVMLFHSCTIGQTGCSQPVSNLVITWILNSTSKTNEPLGNKTYPCKCARVHRKVCRWRWAIRFSRQNGVAKQDPRSACDGDLSGTAAPLTCATAHGDICMCADADVRTELRLQGHVSGSPSTPGSVSVWFVHQQSAKWAFMVQRV